MGRRSSLSDYWSTVLCRRWLGNFDAVNVFFEHITVVEKLFKVLLYDNKDLKRVVNQIIMNFSSIYVSDIVLGDKLDMFPNFVSDLIAFLA